MDGLWVLILILWIERKIQEFYLLVGLKVDLDLTPPIWDTIQIVTALNLEDSSKNEQRAL